MPPDIPQPAQDVMNQYIDLVAAARPGLLAGLYLHGSLALGAFNPRLSDIDYITVASRPCTPDDLAALSEVHGELARRYPKVQLEGCYLQWADLGRPDEALPPHPHFHEGRLNGSGHHGLNGVTWWILKHHGLTLFGPPLDPHAFPLDWDDLLAKMRHNLNTYWAAYTTNPWRIAWLLSDYGIQWTVLGVLRQFYTFREQAITSKTGAGHYALDHLPAQWHQLIQEAINIRAGTRPSAYRSRIIRAMDAYTFLRFIIAACNNCCTRIELTQIK